MTDEIIVRVRENGVFTLEMTAPNMEFIEYLKRRVPSKDRSYDPDTFVWEVRGQQYLAPIEGIAVQKFAFAQRQYYNRDGELTLKNLKTGVETVQKRLF